MADNNTLSWVFLTQSFGHMYCRVWLLILALGQAYLNRPIVWSINV